jgi:biotin carboxyl carrier protein
LTALASGTVVALQAKLGEQVASGALLVEIELEH